jgi:ATPase subunit of ABC transporter with duplicated ATPase domains
MQLLPKASNISSDERSKLLLARLLYDDADILCMDECLDDFD